MASHSAGAVGRRRSYKTPVDRGCSNRLPAVINFPSQSRSRSNPIFLSRMSSPSRLLIIFCRLLALPREGTLPSLRSWYLTKVLAIRSSNSRGILRLRKRTSIELNFVLQAKRDLLPSDSRLGLSSTNSCVRNRSLQGQRKVYRRSCGESCGRSILSPGESKPATYGRFKTSHPEARTSYHFFILAQGQTEIFGGWCFLCLVHRTVGLNWLLRLGG